MLANNKRSIPPFTMPNTINGAAIIFNTPDKSQFIYTMCSDYDRVKAVKTDVPLTSKNCIFISGEHRMLKKESTYKKQLPHQSSDSEAVFQFSSCIIFLLRKQIRHLPSSFSAL